MTAFKSAATVLLVCLRKLLLSDWNPSPPSGNGSPSWLSATSPLAGASALGAAEAGFPSTSTSKLEKRTRDNPNDAQAWRELATALLTKDDKQDEAIAALTRFTELRPKNESALEELAALYIQRGEQYRQQYAVADFTRTSLQPGSQYIAASGSLGQALQEEMVWKDGLLINPGLLEYRSPSSVESPEVAKVQLSAHWPAVVELPSTLTVSANAVVQPGSSPHLSPF